MPAGNSQEITQLLKAWRAGDPAALDHLTPMIYGELRRIAHRYMSFENPGRTLQATELVNEAWIRLVDLQSVDWHDRGHFFAVAAQLMRRILVDAARARAANKRGGHSGQEPLAATLMDQIPAIDPAYDLEIITLNDALDALACWDERKARVVELRFFGGLSVEETADVLGISPQSVKRDWKLARAWLMAEMNRISLS
ncbi:MAG: sigma-70 family RNA polymerase sigma factor [Bryobacterales bacterium]|nr:sigma-70 family RNA polymerase sigma factor [Bryobacterales bacterium]